jgi:hypothetical protein
LVPVHQIRVHPLAEVVAAQQKHNRLIARRGEALIEVAFSEARTIWWRWHDQIRYRRVHNQRLPVLGAFDQPAGVRWEIVQYPEVVALTGILASPHWQRIAVSSDSVETDRFHHEVQRRVIPDYRPGDLFDPLVSWMFRMRQQLSGR